MLDSELHHTIELEKSGPADYRSVVAFFARQMLKELRLVGGCEVLYPLVKRFLGAHLFVASPVNLEDPVVLRNLSEAEGGAAYRFVYVDQIAYERHPPKSFGGLVAALTGFQKE